jgi:hypothetical protein
MPREPPPQVDRLEHADRDFGGERQMAEHVAEVEAPRQRDRDRQDLQADGAMQPEQSGQALAAREEQRGLLPADRDDGDDRHRVQPLERTRRNPQRGGRRLRMNPGRRPAIVGV